MDRVFRKVISAALAAVLSVSVSVGQGSKVSALQYTGTASYMSGKYYTSLREVRLTGDPGTDLVNIARSQVGYQEGGSPNQLSGEVYGGVNHTEYGAWYGTQDMWCAMFVSWCANQAGISTNVIPSHCYTPDGLNWFATRGLAYTREEVQARKYTPKPGDLVYFKSSRNAKTTNHVGIVTGYSNGRVYTIEGNSTAIGITTNGGMVSAHSYPITNTYIVYICAPNFSSGSTSVRSDAKELEKNARLESLGSALTALESGDGLCYDKVTSVSGRSVALGIGQWYGVQARQLLSQIRQADEAAFARLDTAGIGEALDRQDWSAYSVQPGSQREACIKRLLSSEAGIRVQKDWMARRLEASLDRAQDLGITDPDARLLCAALDQLGGTALTEAVLRRAGEEHSVKSLLAAVEQVCPQLHRSCELLIS